MSFLFPFPQDGRVHREDELKEFMASLKSPVQRGPRLNTLDGTSTPAEQAVQDGVPETTPGPDIPRRNIVFPDPVAFR